MASMDRVHISQGKSGSFMNPKLTPKHLTKQEFARRLYQLMIGKGWRQSEMARRAKIQRNAISTYMLGKSFPTAANLRKLAQLFDMEPEDLLPNHIESAIDADNPALSMQVSPGAPDKAWLRINQLVPTALAVKILTLLQEETDAAASKNN